MLDIGSYVKIKNISARISDLSDGDMGLSKDIALLTDKESNRATYLVKRGTSIKNMVIAELNHGANVEIVGREDAGTSIPQTDGLITFEKHLTLAVTTADCLPMFFFGAHAVAVLHAGWRGLHAGIIESMADKLYSLTIDPRTMHVVIGPHICAKCYEVKEDVEKEFEAYHATEVVNGKTCLDLSKVAIAQLRAAGFAHVKDVNICTYENNFFSARRDGLPLRVQMATIEIKSSLN